MKKNERTKESNKQHYLRHLFKGRLTTSSTPHVPCPEHDLGQAAWANPTNKVRLAISNTFIFVQSILSEVDDRRLRE